MDQPSRDNPRARKAALKGKTKMTHVLRTVFYVCCMVTALMSFVAALTITVAMALNKLPDPQAWIAVLFFIMTGGFAWIVGRSLSNR